MKMVLSKLLIDYNRANEVTRDSIESTVQDLQLSGVIDEKLNQLLILPDNPLSPHYRSKDQLITFGENFGFLKFNSVAELLAYIQFKLSGVSQDEAFIASGSGQKLPPCLKFDEKEAALMFKVNVLKFYQNYDLALKLHGTGSSYIDVRSVETDSDSDNLTGKVLMIIRSYINGNMNDEQKLDALVQSCKQIVYQFNLFDQSDKIDDSMVGHLYKQICQQNHVQQGDNKQQIVITRDHILSHHYGDGAKKAKVTIMTYDFDLLTTTSALRLYGTVKLLYNPSENDSDPCKTFAYKYLKYDCPFEHKNRDQVSTEWIKRNASIAFQANLLRYLQNPDEAYELMQTQDIFLSLPTAPKWKDLTPQILMIIRHLFNDHSVDFNGPN